MSINNTKNIETNVNALMPYVNQLEKRIKELEALIKILIQKNNLVQ